MEIIDDDAEKTGIQFVKINDKRLGKSLGIRKFPALTMIRDRQVFIYDGDLKVTCHVPLQSTSTDSFSG